MRTALRDVYAMINKAPDPIVDKIEGIIKGAAIKHGVKVDDIENYFDNEFLSKS